MLEKIDRLFAVPFTRSEDLADDTALFIEDECGRNRADTELFPHDSFLYPGAL